MTARPHEQRSPHTRARAILRRGALAACIAAGLAWQAARAGPPFVTDDPVPVEYQGWEINTAVAGTLVRGGGTFALPGIDANYGPWRGVQIHLQPQLAAIWDGAGTRVGLGDTQIGAKIRLIDQDKDGWLPMVGIYPIYTAPTGAARRGLGAGMGGTFLPVWVDRSFGKWTLDGGGGPSINSGANGRTAFFAGGLLLYQVSDALALGGEIFEQTAQRRGAPSAPGFNLGGSYDLSRTWHVLFSAGRGLVHVSAANRFSFYLGLQLTL